MSLDAFLAGSGSEGGEEEEEGGDARGPAMDMGMDEEADGCAPRPDPVLSRLEAAAALLAEAERACEAEEAERARAASARSEAHAAAAGRARGDAERHSADAARTRAERSAARTVVTALREEREAAMAERMALEADAETLRAEEARAKLAARAARDEEEADAWVTLVPGLVSEACRAHAPGSAAGEGRALAVPGRVAGLVFGALPPRDLAACATVCRAWRDALDGPARAWKEAARLQRRAEAEARWRREEESGARRQAFHEHYSLSIEITKKKTETYLVTVDASEMENGPCRSRLAAGEQPEASAGPSVVKHDKSRRQITVSICELCGDGLEAELDFCRAVIAQNTVVQQLGVDNERLHGLLAESEGLKAERQREITAAQQRLSQAQGDVRTLEQQHRSDEMTQRFLDERIAALERDCNEAEAELARLRETTDAAARRRAARLAELEAATSGKGVAGGDGAGGGDGGGGGGAADDVRELKAHKVVLAKEVKSLQAELVTVKRQQKRYKTEYKELYWARQSEGASPVPSAPRSVAASDASEEATTADASEEDDELASARALL